MVPRAILAEETSGLSSTSLNLSPSRSQSSLPKGFPHNAKRIPSNDKIAESSTTKPSSKQPDCFKIT
eukprot:755707-Amphidinium_carterae.1